LAKESYGNNGRNDFCNDVHDEKNAKARLRKLARLDGRRCTTNATMYATMIN